MTQKWPKCEFADNFASEQARAETRTFLTVVGILCDAFRPPRTRFWGLKFKKIFFVKIVIFFWVFDGSSDPISTHMNGKRMPNSKSAHQVTPGGTKPRKMAYDVIKGH